MLSTDTATLLQARLCELARWLEDEAPFAHVDQRHLDTGTPEQAYWHSGYCAALRDVLALVSGETRGTPGKPSPSQGGALDE